jgi:hypothetical protein
MRNDSLSFNGSALGSGIVMNVSPRIFAAPDLRTSFFPPLVSSTHAPPFSRPTRILRAVAAAVP